MIIYTATSSKTRGSFLVVFTAAILVSLHRTLTATTTIPRTHLLHFTSRHTRRGAARRSEQGHQHTGRACTQLAGYPPGAAGEVCACGRTHVTHTHTHTQVGTGRPSGHTSPRAAHSGGGGRAPAAAHQRHVQQVQHCCCCCCYDPPPHHARSYIHTHTHTHALQPRS